MAVVLGMPDDGDVANEKKARIVHLISPGLCQSGADPQHSDAGKIQVADLIATIVTIGFAVIIAGMGRRHTHIRREIVEAFTKAGKDIREAWWLFLGSSEYEYSCDGKARVNFAFGGSAEKEAYAGLGDMPKDLAWALIDHVGDGVLLVADHQLIKSLGRGDIARTGRLYRLDLDAKTVEMIG